MALVRADRGSVFLEYCFALPIFLALILGSLDVVRYIYQSVSLQYSVANASRWAVLNEQVPNPANPHVDLSRIDSIKYMVQQNAKKYGVVLNNSEIKICQFSDTSCATDSATAVGASQTMTVAVLKNFRTFVGATLNLRASVVVNNENA